MIYNFHTHSHFDDGQMTLEDYVVEAIDRGFDALGFSGHSPLTDNNGWSINKADLPEYVAEAKRLRHQYNGQIRLFVGLEIDYVPGLSDDFDAYRREIPLDYCIGSVHLVRNPENGLIWITDGPEENYTNGLATVFGGDARKAVTAYFEQSMQMVETQRLEIIGHLDKVKMHNRGRFFDPSEGWYQRLVDRLLQVIARHPVIVEVNTRGVYTGKSDEYFPSLPVLERCLQLGIPVMVNSDAHHPGQLSNHVAEAETLLYEIGFCEITTPLGRAPLGRGGSMAGGMK